MELVLPPFCSATAEVLKTWDPLVSCQVSHLRPVPMLLRQVYSAQKRSLRRTHAEAPVHHAHSHTHRACMLSFYSQCKRNPWTIKGLVSCKQTGESLSTSTDWHQRSVVTAVMNHVLFAHHMWIVLLFTFTSVVKYRDLFARGNSLMRSIVALLSIQETN